MSWVAAGVGVAGLAVGVYGQMSGASAADKAAKQRQQAAKNWQDQVSANKDQAMSLVSSPAAMAAHDQALQAQEHQVQRQEQLAQSINPALIEQGKQYMQLLQGKSAPVLKNLQDQRGLQRQQLVSQLQQQMGPGAETSTAGMQALNQFDQQTANTLSQAQMQYTGMMEQGSLAAPGAMNASGTANLQLGELNKMSPDAQKAQLLAQFSGMQGQSQNAMIDAAGADQTGNVLRGQAYTSIGNSMQTFAGGMAGKRQPGTLGGDLNGGGGVGGQTGPIDRSGGQVTQADGSNLKFS